MKSFVWILYKKYSKGATNNHNCYLGKGIILGIQSTVHRAYCTISEIYASTT